jgi:chromosome segregation ATPase
MSSFTGLTNLPEYLTSERQTEQDRTPSSFYDSPDRSKSDDDFSVDSKADHADWRCKNFTLPGEGKKHTRLASSLTSLTVIVEGLQREVSVLRGDRKQLRQQLELLTQQNKALRSSRTAGYEVADLRSKLMKEREKFQEELAGLAGQLEILQKELNKVKGKRTKQSEMQRRVKSRQIELIHSQFSVQLEEKDRHIKVRATQTLEAQNSQLVKLAKGDSALSPSRKPSEKRLSPKRRGEFVKKMKLVSSLHVSAERLEDELEGVRTKLHRNAKTPSKHKEKTRLGCIRLRCQEERERLERLKHRKGVKEGSETNPPMKFSC